MTGTAPSIDVSPTPRTPSAEDAAASVVAARLEAAFRVVADGPMRDVPLVNPALTVEAIGFRAWGSRIVGVMATPWFMNLVVTAPPDGPELEPASPGSTVVHAFPSGDFPCVVGAVDGFGRLDSASFFSPMFEFDDPAVVRAVAEAAIEEVFRAPEPEPEPQPETRAPAAIDRRALLFGRRGGEG